MERASLARQLQSDGHCARAEALAQFGNTVFKIFGILSIGGATRGLQLWNLAAVAVLFGEYGAAHSPRAARRAHRSTPAPWVAPDGSRCPPAREGRRGIRKVDF